jgi:hypothetical protein
VTTNDHERLEHILDRWEAGRRAGRPPTTSDLCADAPHLRDLVTQRVRMLEWAARNGGNPEDSIAPSAMETALADSSPSVTAVAPDWLAPGEQLADGLVLVRLLGRGGMGEVWEANDTRLNRRVAVKFLHLGMADNAIARRRFAREAKACASVQHENVVAVFSVGEHRGRPYLVMPLLDGETLSVRIRRDGPLPLDELVRVARAVASGLSALHANGLTHRDLKPANIWLSPDGAVKLLDLGLAHTTHLEQEDEPISRFGIVLGTPAYMAPEQAEGLGVAPATDLFSLGVVLYQSATGSNPFVGTSVLSTLSALISRTPPPPSDLRAGLPPALDELVLGLMAKRPTDRHPNTAAGVVERLDAIAAGARPVRRAVGRKRPRWPWAVGLAALGVAVAIPLVMLSLAPPSPEEQVRQVARQLREQPVENFRTADKTGGVFKNMRHNEYTFTGSTGVPVCSEVRDGTAVIKLPYAGEYERKSWDVVLGQRLPITVPEAKTISGVIEVTVAVDRGGVRMTDYKLVPTAGDVEHLGHDANVSAEAALLALVRQVLPE